LKSIYAVLLVTGNLLIKTDIERRRTFVRLDTNMHISPCNINIRDLSMRILSSRSMSGLEQEVISNLLQHDELGDQERTLIRRIFYGVRHGLLTVVE
jgi:hypothetical protein